MLERAGGRDDHLAGQAEQGGQGGQRPLQVVRPDVAAVDHPGDQGPVADAAGGGQQLEVAGAVAGQVEADAVDRGAGEHPEGVAQEMWALFAVYQAIHTLIGAAVDATGIPPEKISFPHALAAATDTVTAGFPPSGS